VQPFEVRELGSSFFADPVRFPRGSVIFDHALAMRDVPHSWHGRAQLVIGNERTNNSPGQ
jgi:hypothetical protein